MHLDGGFYNVFVDSNMVPWAVTPDNVNDPAILRKFHEAVQDVRQRLKKAKITIPGPYLNGREVLVVKQLTELKGPCVFYMCYDRGMYLELFPKGYPEKGQIAVSVVRGDTTVADHFTDILIEHKTERFWTEVAAYPMHLIRLPINAEVDFLTALSFGANGRSIFCLAGNFVLNSFPRTNN